MARNNGNIFSITFRFANGTALSFWSNYSKVALERGAEWLELDEIDWIDMIWDSVYGGAVFIKTSVEFEPVDPADAEEEWKQTKPEITERQALYIFSWSDVESIRVIYKEPGED